MDVLLKQEIVTLFWLLEELVICSTQFRCETGPQVVQKMCEAVVTTLGQLVNMYGAPHLDYMATLARHVGGRSVRVLNHLLGGWTHQLSASELELMIEYCGGRRPANHNDPFPDVRLTHMLGNVLVLELFSVNVQPDNFSSATGKNMYNILLKF